MTQILDKISMYSALAAAGINVVIIVLILARTSRTLFHRLFLFVSVSVLVWNLGVFLKYATGRKAWFYFGIIGSPILPAFLFHMTNVLLNRPRQSAWIRLGYVLGGLLSLCSLLAVYSPAVKAFVDSPYRYLYYILLLLPFVGACIVMLSRALPHASTDVERSQIRHLLAAIGIGGTLSVTELIWIFGSPLPRLSQVGSATFSVILITGILKNRKAYDILSQMRSRLVEMEEMAAGIVHELRNPLGSIRGAASLIASGSAPDTKEYIDVMREEVARLDCILMNFQNLSRPIRVTKEPIPLNDLVRRTVRIAAAGLPGLAITVDAAEGLPPVAVDTSMLSQVIMNLIKNAAEACGERGELLIKTEAGGRGVTVTFRDSGPGISPQVLRQIFEPFFTTKRTGMGMGLAISKRIVEAHSGTIEAGNAGATGAEFVVSLPLA